MFLSNYAAIFSLLQTLICGLLGLPPSNGVLPQSPMHTKSLAVLRKQVSLGYHIGFLLIRSVIVICLHNRTNLQVIRKKMVKSAKECIKLKATNSEMFGRMEAVFIEMDGGSPPNVSAQGRYIYIYIYH